MRLGTKSLLFGVHQLVWHPITVGIAWRRLYGVWPNWWQWISIALHDSGYWSCRSLDGDDGIQHPQAGARRAAKIAGLFSAEAAFNSYFLCLYHSASFARTHNAEPSLLYLPDKASLLVESKAWYLFRARLSGELVEFVARESVKKNVFLDEDAWYDTYRASVQKKVDSFLCLKKS